LSQSLATRTTRDAVTIAHLREIVEQLAARDRSGEVLTTVRHIPAREAKFAPMPEWVRKELAAVYAEKGVSKLYSHQAAAAAAVGQDVAALVAFGLGHGVYPPGVLEVSKSSKEMV